MFHTFTGSSRRPRQVNLSGRTNPNPFAPSGFGFGKPQGASHDAVANAQLDRKLRQEERQRQQAATTLQKTWRGHATRKRQKHRCRQGWDEQEPGFKPEAGAVKPQSYSSGEACLSQLRLLLRFYDFRELNDVTRLRHLFQRLFETRAAGVSTCNGSAWTASYLQLEETCLITATKSSRLWDRFKDVLTTILLFAVEQTPVETAQHAAKYYAYVSQIPWTEQDFKLITGPLDHLSSSTPTAYLHFALEYLTKLPPFLLRDRQSLENIASSINPRLLASSLAMTFNDPSSLTRDGNHHIGSLQEMLVSHDPEQWVTLLALFIFCYRHAHDFVSQDRYAADEDFILVVSTLLTYTADELDGIVSPPRLDQDGDQKSEEAHMSRSEFIRDQILSLVNQQSIGGLLGHLVNRANVPSSSQSGVDPSQQTRILASYVLTLIRLVPQSKGDEIRMWLYLGISNPNDGTATGHRFSAIEFFWDAMVQTHIFDTVMSDSRSAIDLLKPRLSDRRQALTPGSLGSTATNYTQIDDQWRVILLFIELYIFVLKVMDDEEFFSKISPSIKTVQHQNLGLKDIMKLSTFLKHLGFTMYYNAADITESEAPQDQPSISSMFSVNDMKQANESSARVQRVNHIAGLRGMSLDYVKGLVTGLIRAIYERDSRRPFLPKDHWLMTYRFDMTSFIDAVVEEEEKRNKVQEEQDEDMDDDDFHDEEDMQSGRNFVGTGRAQREMRMQKLRKQQAKASRRRYLQAVAPRLEILQNMPFLIPFRTRVQIFRRFVHLDQFKRRNGMVDPELWRLSQSTFRGGGPHSNPLERHHAKIRRQYEFEDAYEQFYELGPALREPIQITFVDKFGTVEAGIDGGGVTKEFLTSVTDQAFARNDGIQLFVENEQRLLYPNPSAVDEQKELLREVGLRDDSTHFRAQVSDLLQRYEFLGRIIGKCLYEGILVDLSFAGFFLLKWALTGGTGSAPKESGYRANLNDLRELDESLYQGLLQLKNYPGDVETDFDTNFTVTDTITTENGRTKTITRDLIPNGASIPVTNSNRLVYISYISRHRLQAQPFQQTAAFLRGLGAIIQPSWLSMFNQSELQTLVGGTAGANINVDDLRDNTTYGGLYVIGDDNTEHPCVRLFWQVMYELPDEDRRKVLKFVTSTPRAPLLGFGSLNPRFSIRDAGEDESRLPSTSTCVNLLKLPRYTNKERLRSKLLQAVSSGAGFDLS